MWFNATDHITCWRHLTHKCTIYLYFLLNRVTNDFSVWIFFYLFFWLVSLNCGTSAHSQKKQKWKSERCLNEWDRWIWRVRAYMIARFKCSSSNSVWEEQEKKRRRLMFSDWFKCDFTEWLAMQNLHPIDNMDWYAYALRSYMHAMCHARIQTSEMKIYTLTNKLSCVTYYYCLLLLLGYYYANNKTKSNSKNFIHQNFELVTDVAWKM